MLCTARIAPCEKQRRKLRVEKSVNFGRSEKALPQSGCRPQSAVPAGRRGEGLPPPCAAGREKRRSRPGAPQPHGGRKAKEKKRSSGGEAALLLFFKRRWEQREGSDYPDQTHTSGGVCELRRSLAGNDAAHKPAGALNKRAWGISDFVCCSVGGVTSRPWQP